MTGKWFHELQHRSIGNVQSKEQKENIGGGKNRGLVTCETISKPLTCIYNYNVRQDHLGGSRRGGIQGWCFKHCSIHRFPLKEESTKMFLTFLIQQKISFDVLLFSLSYFHKPSHQWVATLFHLFLVHESPTMTCYQYLYLEVVTGTIVWSTVICQNTRKFAFL